MESIERRDSTKNKMQRAIKHLIIGATLDTLGMLIILCAYSFPEVNPLSLKVLPLPAEAMYVIGGFFIMISLLFLKKGITVIQALNTNAAKRAKD